MRSKFIFIILILTLASMACGFNIDIPEAPTPGPLVTDEITVPAPSADETRLKLSFGAGDLILSPGAEKNLVEGTASYNYEQFKPSIETDGNDVTIKMGNIEFNGFPTFNELENKWDFKLGSNPMELVIEAGAYDATYEFGGLALTDLSITDGAADVELSFSELNPVEMSLFRYETGASDVKMTGLSNANFSAFSLTAGAGDYTLDFSGDLQRDATATIEAGLSNIIIVVPEGVNAVVKMQTGASNVNVGSGWSQNGDSYTQDGEGPTLTIIVEIGAGNLTITK